jgi:hypothetical protein
MISTALPFRISLFAAISHHISPPPSDSWLACSCALPSRDAQYGAKAQWADPVTESSGIP